MNLTYKEFRLIENIVKYCKDLLPDIDIISSNYYDRMVEVFECDISIAIIDRCLINKVIDFINHECDLFVSCLRCPEDFDCEYPKEDIEFNYNILNIHRYEFIIKNDIYNLTINVDNSRKIITVAKELNGNKFEMTIEYDCNY